MSMGMRCLRQLIYSIHTAALFTKSDIKTTLLPVTFFAAAAAPIAEIARLSHVLFWIWFHLLQFDVSNQTQQPEEDALNKRDRPLPSNRISLQKAILLRWALIPACLALSSLYGVGTVYASGAVILLTLIYNECSAHAGHWLVRNVVNAAGLASFEVGATLVGAPKPRTLDNTAVLAVCISAGILATTIQAQDFKDVHGDRAIRRRTMPIIFPSTARYTVIVPLLLWSGGLSALWKLDLGTGFIFGMLALFVGIQFFTSRTVRAYQISYYWYNLWVSMAHALPGYYRLMHNAKALP